MLKIFACDSIICQLDVVGCIVWKTYTQVKLHFRDTVKNLGNSSDLSASPETLSMTISLLIMLVSPFKISISLSTYLFLWKKCQVHIKLAYCLRIFKTYTLLKTRRYIFFSFTGKRYLRYPKYLVQLSKQFTFC